jgi:NAD(P)-dependent dehydrogenase (short-subunit alcohol dehydrogenase family)
LSIGRETALALARQGKDYIGASTAVARLGMPNDIGNVIAFLCSPEASFISGAIIPIDGGYHL